ncbi:UDP-glucuronate 4-epimerase [Bacillus ectoiniformans]|uniref:SDR family NAD(P)-dependent oxidoreductase n=1 Tax=Bacillus ectoiniformans TaxID=1494429 RepID=UPI00195661DA|nr:SDR family NAD(P)-dependent oxidoreductase [Bacillus ectoiniformans]MBM7648888.1 UDP-glucuronate 4-epimerase [Bacillus ectoiniformans]
MKVLVTGGAGFIGMHTASTLIELGYEVHIADLLHSYYSLERKNIHLQQIEKTGKFHFCRVDLTDRKATAELFTAVKPDAVIHLAALPGVAYSLEEPLLYVDYDVKATINVLEAAGKSDVKKVVFASSSSVYGDQPGKPLKEEMANGQVISPYAASKWSAESFCHVYASLYSYSVSILRFFTVYGPWGRPDMAIAKFIKLAMNGQPVEIYGQGSGRDYTYVDDIVNGIVLSLTDEKPFEIWNVGAGHPVLMSRLLERLKMYFPALEVQIKGHRTGDVTSTWADISKMTKDKSYRPTVSIEEGLERTIKWAYENKEYL